VDNSKREIFKKIIKSDPHYSRSLSSEAADLLKKLLNKNINKRIKPQDIPTHPFFSGIDFVAINNLEILAPITPKIVSSCKYFLKI
jgi:serine/threonine protein kinase